MTNSELVAQIRTKYQAFLPYLNERTQRIWAGIEATALGQGGISQVSRATGLSRTTIYTGLRELQNGSERADSTDGTSRIRQAGGGRKKLTEIDPTLMDDLKGLVVPMMDLGVLKACELYLEKKLVSTESGVPNEEAYQTRLLFWERYFRGN